MTLYEFIALDEAEQSQSIWDAVQIGEREDSEHRIKLFQIDGAVSYCEAVFFIIFFSYTFFWNDRHDVFIKRMILGKIETTSSGCFFP